MSDIELCSSCNRDAANDCLCAYDAEDDLPTSSDKGPTE